MGLKEWLIKKLESSVEPDAGYIDLQKISGKPTKSNHKKTTIKDNNREFERD